MWETRGVADSASGGKFWEVKVEGSQLTATWGEVGTDGSSKTKDLGTEEKALKEAEKLAKSKEKGGYVMERVGAKKAVGKAAKRKAPECSGATKRAKGNATVKEEATGTWEYYGDGTWNVFSHAASAWLEAALSTNSGEVVWEGSESKKKSYERRIRLVPPGDDKPCDTDAEQLAWVDRLGFYLIKASLMKRVKEM